MGGERRHRRQEDELTGSTCRGQDADDESLMRAEPTRGDERRQITADEASGQADYNAPQQDELPRFAHRRGQRDARGGRRQRQDHRAARPNAIHHRRSERTDRPVEQQVDADGDGNRCPRPVEFLFKRDDQDTRRRAHASGHDHHRKGDGDDDPSVMQPRRWWADVQQRHTSFPSACSHRGCSCISRTMTTPETNVSAPIAAMVQANPTIATSNPAVSAPIA